MSTPAPRGSHGHFLPGNSGNPGGSSGRAALEALRSKLRTHTDEAVAALVRLLKDDDPSIRLRAVEVFLDRLVGKPIAVTEAEVRSTHVDVAQLGQLYIQAMQGVSERANAADAPANAKDVTPPQEAQEKSEDGGITW
jgi:hypothetical protein